MYACESTLPSDSACLTSTILRGSTRRSLGVAEELVEWKRASNSPRALASRAGGMMMVGERGGGVEEEEEEEEREEEDEVEVEVVGLVGVVFAFPFTTSLVARANATASPEAAPLAAALRASVSALVSSLAVSAWSLATSSWRRSSCAERASSSATSAGVLGWRRGRDSSDGGEVEEPLEPLAAFAPSDCGGGVATCSLLLLGTPEGEEEEADAPAAIEEEEGAERRR